MKTQSWISRALLPGAAFLVFLAVPLAQADYQSTVLSQNPSGYWRLDETTPPPTPASTAAVNQGSLGATGAGVYTNGAIRGYLPGAIVSQPTSSAARFPGAIDGNRVRIPYNAQLNPAGPFTVEFWAKPGQTTALQCPAASVEFSTPRYGWLFYQGPPSADSGNGWFFRIYEAGGANRVAAISMPINVNKWYHVVGVYDGSSIKLYVDGVQVASTATVAAFAPTVNPAIPFTFGARADGLAGYWTYNGVVDEGAFYAGVLTPERIMAHYEAGTNAAPAIPYQQVVSADSPVGYWRFNEQGDPVAANLGALGAAADAVYVYNAAPGVAGPAYTGLGTANKAVSFDGSGGLVRTPNLNLNTNAVTISAWVKASGSQPLGAGLVLCSGGTTRAGLTIDQIFGGLGLGYIWNDNHYGWSPSSDSFLPALPDGDWAYVALVVQPKEAALYICDRNNYANFAAATNTFNVNHINQLFDAPTLFGVDAREAARNFNGAIDEVTVFKRALGAGELYTQYGAAIGGVPARIFGDLQGPVEPVFAGDPLVLTVDAGGTPPLTYTWRKNGATIATTADGVLTIASTTLLDSGNYDVVIASASGSPATSQQVAVTINPATAPQILQSQGFVDRTLYTGGTLKMSITASGGALAYQWYKNSALITSATGSSYTIPAVTTNDAGSFSVSVTNALGQASNGPVVISIPAYGTGTYEALVIGSGPVSWYRLNETGGTNLWDGMGRHDGYYTSLNGSVPPVTFGASGAVNNNPDTAITITPSRQGVGVVPYNPELNPNIYSVEVWVKTTVTTAEIYPLSCSYTPEQGWYWRTLNGFWNGNNAPIQDYGATTAGINPGVWTHLVLTYDRTRGGGNYPYQYFVNGRGDAGYIWSGPPLNVAGPLIIGGRGVSAASLAEQFFDGQVDEVAIYPRLLSATEIQNHFQGRFGSSTPPTFVGTLTSQTVPAGKTVTFSTTVQGTLPITLQWYKDGNRLTGATTSTLTLNNVTPANDGTYTLWATNSAGTNFQSATLTVIPAVGYANVTNELVLHLRFDGNTSDSSGRGNNGTPVGSPTFTPGIIGSQALEYSTAVDAGLVTANYVELGRPADLLFDANASFTIGLWVKLPVNYDGGDLPFIGTAVNSMNNPGWDLGPTYGGGGWQWCLNDGVSPGIVTNNIDVNGPAASISDGSWHHFVLTVDRTARAATSYLDGVLAASRDITALGNLDNGRPVIIGQDPTGVYAEAGSATLDDLGVWRRALTQLEVINIYSAGSTAGRSFDTVPPATVTMTVTRSGSNVTISWTSGTLQESDTLGAGANWTAVQGAAPPSHTFTPAGTGNKFYRVWVQ